MEPQKQSHNPKHYIINLAQLQQHQCIICTEYSLTMMRCKKCKRCICNQCSIDQKTKNNKCPIRCSPGPYELELIPEFLPLFRCPFSFQCKVVLKCVKDFHQHSRFCGYINEGQKEEESNKWNFTCPKKHCLQMKLGSYEQLIKRQKCGACHEHGIMRVECKKCDEFYCNYCRPLPLYKSKCPGGHELIKRDVRTLSYRCDICQISPAMLDIQLDDDFICNYGICGICYKNWPEFQHRVPYIVNQRNYCELVSNMVLIQKLSKEELSKLKQQHRLTILQKQTIQKCSWCEKLKFCYKSCVKCNKYYCFSCKKIQVFQNRTCQFDHQFAYIQIQNMEQLLEKSKICYSCNSQLSLKQPRVKQFFIDNVCGVILCRGCYISALQHNFDVTYKHISLEVNSCKDSPTHPLFYLPAGRDFSEICYSCNERTVIKFNCSMCEKPKLYCCKCVPSTDLKKCYCGRVLENSEKTLCACLLCLEAKPVHKCGPCGYAICSDCMGEKVEMIELMEQVQAEKVQG